MVTYLLLANSIWQRWWDMIPLTRLYVWQMWRGFSDTGTVDFVLITLEIILGGPDIYQMKALKRWTLLFCETLPQWLWRSKFLSQEDLWEATWQGNVICPKEPRVAYDWQQKTGNLNPTTTRNWILPTTTWVWQRTLTFQKGT